MKTKYMREEQLKAMVENLKNLNNLLSIENDILRDELSTANSKNEEFKRELKKLKHLL